MSTAEFLRPTPQAETETVPKKSFQNLMDFLAVQVFPIDLKTQVPPKNSNQNQEKWERNLRITGVYAGTDPDQTLDEIGGDDLSRERIRQIVNNAVKRLWQIQTPQLKETFPWESLDFDKSHTLAGRQKQSQKRGGISLKVVQLVSQGKSATEIREILEISGRSLCAVRQTLKNWGIEVPRQKRVRERFASLADPKLSDREVQKVLDTITRYTYIVLSQGEKPLLTKLSNLARDAGLIFSSRDIGLISAVLKKAGVRIGFVANKHNYRRKSGAQTNWGYHFIRTLDRNRAVSMFKQAPEAEHLRINPVTVLGKTSGEMPSVNVSKLKSGEFASVMNLIAEIRGRRIGSGSKIKLTDVVEDNCPVSIYQYDKRGRSGSHNTCSVYRYRLEQKEELKAYLAKRLKSLGLL